MKKPLASAAIALALAAATLVSTTSMTTASAQMHSTARASASLSSQAGTCTDALRSGGYDALASFVVAAMNAQTIDLIRPCVAGESVMVQLQSVITLAGSLESPTPVKMMPSNGIEEFVSYATGANGGTARFSFNAGSSGEFLVSVSWTPTSVEAPSVVICSAPVYLKVLEARAESKGRAVLTVKRAQCVRDPQGNWSSIRETGATRKIRLRQTARILVWRTTAGTHEGLRRLAPKDFPKYVRATKTSTGLMGQPFFRFYGSLSAPRKLVNQWVS